MSRGAWEAGNDAEMETAWIDAGSSELEGKQTNKCDNKQVMRKRQLIRANGRTRAELTNFEHTHTHDNSDKVNPDR